MIRLSAAALLTLASLGVLWDVAPANAATSGVSPTGFVVTLKQEIKASPHQVYESLSHIDKWWNSHHTWSGDAANLSLATQASACFCEKWGKNSVEHGHVVYAADDSVLRLQAALGPLQALSVNAILTFDIAERDGTTMLQVTYRVAGNEAAGLAELASTVDGVLAEQVRRLTLYAEGGKVE